MIDKYLNKIFQGDCLELFKDIPDNSVDMAFADPPFNLQKNTQIIRIILNFRNIWIGAKSGFMKWCE